MNTPYQHLPRSLEIPCQSSGGTHTMRAVSLGNPNSPSVVVCVHGLTRSADDFVVLGQELANTHWVIAVDVAGRGESDFLANPADYHIGQYALDMARLWGQLDLSSRRVHWVGTSMGGLIAMALMGTPSAALTGMGLPVPRPASLVLNDVGAMVEGAALARIGQYVQLPTVMRSWAEARIHIRRRFAAFGDHSDAHWEILMHAVVREDPSTGEIRFRYDPRIADVFVAGLAAAPDGIPPPIDLWQLYDQIQCPTLLLRGELSDLLSKEVALQMTQRGPRATLLEFANIGHAPSLLPEDQVAAVVDFIYRQPT